MTTKPKKKTTHKKTHAKAHPKKKNPAKKTHAKAHPKKRRTTRRKNPGIPGFVKGLAGAAVGGVVGAGAMMVISRTTLSPKAKAGALVAGGLALGLGVSLIDPAFGAGLGAGGIATGGIAAVAAIGASATTQATPASPSVDGGRPPGALQGVGDLGRVYAELGQVVADLDVDDLEEAMDGVYFDDEALPDKQTQQTNPRNPHPRKTQHKWPLPASRS
jgi:hypothetical protein